MALAVRREGQIWIDKNNTHRLKYYTKDVTYEVATSQTFSTAEAPEAKKGQLVASSGGKLVAAVWPDDAEKVLGVVTGIEMTKRGEKDIYTTSVTSNERIILTAAEMSNCFVDGAALPVAAWGTDEKKGIGCPVYWFIGLSESTTSYVDSTDKPGKLTFKTPSGFKYGVTSVTDDKFNISYDNLPIVGHVVDYKYSGNNFTKLTIDLHIANYTPTVTWNYPGIRGTVEGRESGILPSDGQTENKFYHGLFADNTKSNICTCSLAIRATKTSTSESGVEEYTIVAPYKNVIKADHDRYTSITFNSIENFRYRITGTVHYNIDRSSN